MSLFKKSELDKIRKRCIEEFGYDIPNEEWDKIINDLEESTIEGIKKGLNNHIFESEN